MNTESITKVFQDHASRRNAGEEISLSNKLKSINDQRRSSERNIDSEIKHVSKLRLEVLISTYWQLDFLGHIAFLFTKMHWGRVGSYQKWARGCAIWGRGTLFYCSLVHSNAYISTFFLSRVLQPAPQY